MRKSRPDLVLAKSRSVRAPTTATLPGIQSTGSSNSSSPACSPCGFPAPPPPPKRGRQAACTATRMISHVVRGAAALRGRSFPDVDRGAVVSWLSATAPRDRGSSPIRDGIYQIIGVFPLLAGICLSFRIRWILLGRQKFPGVACIGTIAVDPAHFHKVHRSHGLPLHLIQQRLTDQPERPEQRQKPSRGLRPEIQRTARIATNLGESLPMPPTPDKGSLNTRCDQPRPPGHHSLPSSRDRSDGALVAASNGARCRAAANTAWASTAAAAGSSARKAPGRQSRSRKRRSDLHQWRHRSQQPGTARPRQVSRLRADGGPGHLITLCPASIMRQCWSPCSNSGRKALELTPPTPRPDGLD